MKIPAPSTSFPRLYAAASLKPSARCPSCRLAAEFSAALCRGLIEAARTAGSTRTTRRCFPRLYAAASLKQRCNVVRGGEFRRFSAALCRGLIEASRRSSRPTSRPPFSAALAVRPNCAIHACGIGPVLTMVPVATSSPILAPDARYSVSVILSLPSSCESFTTATSTVFSVSPGANRTAPGAAT